MSLTFGRVMGVVDGYEVVVEARSGVIASRYRLLVEGEPHDSGKVVQRDLVLKGLLPSGKVVCVRVEVSAFGLGGQRYVLVADGRERRLGHGWLL